MAEYPVRGLNPWDAALKAYIDAAIAERAVAPPEGAANGQTLVYNSTLGLWVPSNPVGNSLNVGTQNVSSVATAASAGPAVGFGTFVDVASTAISVLNSGGREVKIEFEATFQQTVVGTGQVWLALAETTSGTVYRRYLLRNLPNSVTTGSNQVSMNLASVNLGVVTTTRTFKLVLVVYALTGSPAASLLNQPTHPTIVRAINQ